MSSIHQEAVFAIGQISAGVLHPRRIGVGRDSGNLDPSSLQMHDRQDVKVVSPLPVQTSTVVKSVAKMQSRWAFKNVDHAIVR